MARKSDKKTPKRTAKPIYKIIVNYWATKFHSATMGIKKDVEYQAASPQFTKEYEIKGDVIFNDDEEGDEFTKQVVAVNVADFSAPSPDRRLMIRTFTELKDGKGGHFMGTIEESMLESLGQSSVSNKPSSVFIVMIPKIKYLTRIYRMRTITGNHFTFILLPEKKDEPVHFIHLKGVIGMGDDFEILEGDKKIGKIDGKKFDIGGKYVITIDDEYFQRHRIFQQIIILFSAVLKYLKDVEDDIEELWKRVKEGAKEGEYYYTPHPQELDLFKNPRKTIR